MPAAPAARPGAAGRPLTVIECDGSPATARAVLAALERVLTEDGSAPAVLPPSAASPTSPVSGGAAADMPAGAVPDPSGTLAGAVPDPSGTLAGAVPDPPGTLAGVGRDCAPGGGARTSRGDGVPAVLPVAAGPEGARVVAALRPGEPADVRTALVVATSGSTGRPKGVELSAAALRASATATHERLGGPGGWLLALPPHHVAGAQVLVRSLLAGHAPAVLDLRGGFDPASFAAAAHAVPAAGAGRRYTALVPTQLVRLLDAGGAPLEALRAFDAVLVGGAACPPALLSRARATGVSAVTTYGMTETAGGCVYDGRPLEGVRVRITPDRAGAGGPTGDPAAGDPAAGDPAAGDGSAGDRVAAASGWLGAGGGPAARGRIELGGPTLALGYRLDPAGTAAAFQDGWFRTGDAGTLAGDGTLDVLGRLDDMIVTGGRKVAPALVERALAAIPGVAEACVAGLPDAEWGALVAAAVVASDPADPPTPQALRAAVRAAAGPHAVPKIIRVVAALPGAGLGKPDRAAVRQLLAAAPRPVPPVDRS